jgi:hypothetical protein
LDRWGKCCSSLGQIETSEKKFALALVKVALVNDIPEQLKSAFTNQVKFPKKCYAIYNLYSSQNIIQRIQRRAH